MVEHKKNYKRDEIREYVESQSRGTGDKVTRVEWLRTEHMWNETHEVWDVWTEQDRFWVISNLTNLYSQSDFKSLDQAIVYHFGLRLVLAQRQSKNAPTEQAEKAAAETWRLFDRTTRQLDEAEEAEDFQAVGMRARETLLSFMRELVAKDDLELPTDGRPKRGDFVGWAAFIEDHIASGPSQERLRSLMKSTAQETWNYVNWLTHAKNASRVHGEIAVEALRDCMHLFTLHSAYKRFKVPERCPTCRSYRVTYHWIRESGTTMRVCNSCDWEEEVADEPQS